MYTRSAKVLLMIFWLRICLKDRQANSRWWLSVSQAEMQSANKSLCLLRAMMTAKTENTDNLEN